MECPFCSKEEKIEKHHLLPRAQKGKNHQANIMYLTAREHRSWHFLFHGGMTVMQIAAKINKMFIDPRFQLIVIERRPK